MRIGELSCFCRAWQLMTSHGPQPFPRPTGSVEGQRQLRGATVGKGNTLSRKGAEVLALAEPCARPDRRAMQLSRRRGCVSQSPCCWRHLSADSYIGEGPSEPT